MQRALALTLPMLSAGCAAVNIYWTDYVVHGELHLRENAAAKREPIPLELKVKGEEARQDCSPRTAPASSQPQ